MGCRRVSAVHCDGGEFWIAEAHHRGGKRFDVRAEEKLSIAKALTKERQPRYGAIALRLPAGLQCLSGVIYKAFSCTPHPITESSPMIMTSLLNGGAGLAGKSGRRTANACDTNASEMSANTTAHFIFVARNTFIKVSNIVVQ
jgi:hypothetical protein